MLYITGSSKNIQEAVEAVEAAAKANGFGVLAIMDLKAKMREKGIEFANECRVVEVCNPKYASRVLAEDMRVSLALPCRISVYEEGGRTMLGTIKPLALIGMLNPSARLVEIAAEVESVLLRIIDEAR